MLVAVQAYETYLAAVLYVAEQKGASHVRIVPRAGIADISILIDHRWWPEDSTEDHARVMIALCGQLCLPMPDHGDVKAGRLAIKCADESVLLFLVSISHTDAGLTALVEIVDEPTFNSRSEPAVP